MNYSNELTKVHFVHKYLLSPTNPVLVNLIGAGGTGSQVLSALARINQSLIALEHPGLQVRLFDNDIVTEANLGRQLFSDAEVGMHKSVALINRFNRFYGSSWKAFQHHYDKNTVYRIPEEKFANITITCVDSPKARFEIADILTGLYVKNEKEEKANKPLYWLDFGNSRYTGQAVLSTLCPIQQPTSKKFAPVSDLPLMTVIFKDLLMMATDDDTPSCSLAEALLKQDLFINSALANAGGSLLWQMFTEGMLFNKGFFLNIKEFTSLPIAIDYAPVYNGIDTEANTAIAA